MIRYRDAGVAPTRVIGLMASWCGIVPERIEMSAEEFRAGLDLSWFRDTLGRAPIVFGAEDEAWLTATTAT